MNGTMIGMFGEAVAAEQSDLVRIPLAGGQEQVLVEPATISGPAVSPDGRRIAYAVGAFAESDVWVLDVARGTRTRLTFNEGRADWRPVWSPDGKSIAYSSAGTRGGAGSRLSVKSADGSGDERSASSKPNLQVPEQWTRDGATIIFAQNVAGNWGVWKTSATEEAEHEIVIDTPALELSPRLSTDDRWLAYQSGESGRPESLRPPLPGPGGKWQISTQGGTEPRWSGAARSCSTAGGLALLGVGCDRRVLDRGRTATGPDQDPAGPGARSGPTT